MNALQAEIKQIWQKLDQNKDKTEEKRAELGKIRKDIPAGIFKEEHARL